MSKSLDRFWEQQKLAERLVKICESDADDDHVALSRAGVVFCVASWQAYTENVVRESHDEIRSKISRSNVDEATLLNTFFRLNKELLEKRIKQFNTPSSQHVRELFEDTLGINPNEFWDNKAAKNPGMAMVANNKVKIGNTQEILKFWINVRHSIAHGSDLPKDERYGRPKAFHLNHTEFKHCMHFFSALAKQTDAGLNSCLDRKFAVTLKNTKTSHDNGD